MQASKSLSPSSHADSVSPLLNELKIRARLLLNALQAEDANALTQCQRICQRQDWPLPEAWRLRHALNIVANQAGFMHYEHARKVLHALPALQVVEDAAFVQRVLASFIENGRLLKIPQMRKKRMVILAWLVAQLEPQRRYPESEINSFLLQYHEDFATLRREFIASKLMARANEMYWCLPQ